MSPRSALVAVALGWVCLIPALRSAPGQDPADQTSQAPRETLPTFRSVVRYVEIDADVRDRDGQFVTGLTKNDFEVSEDGKLQTIDKVTAVDIPIENRRVSRIASVPVPIRPKPDLAFQDAGRVYVMVIASDSYPAKEFARLFIEQYLGSSDLMALVNGANRYGLTWNRQRLLAAVNEPARYVRQPFTILKDAVVNLGAVTGRRKSILYIGDGPRGLWSLDEFVDDRWKELNDLTRTARALNVPIHVINPGGRANSDLDSASHLLAGDTGGTAIVHTNNYREHLQRIVEANSLYYMIGYYSSAETDGQYHRVRVRVLRKGVTVQAREGFRAANPPVKGKGVDLPKALSKTVRAVLKNGSAVAGLPIETSIMLFRGEGFTGSVVVETTIPGTGLNLSGDQKLEYVATAVDGWGKVRAVDRRAFSLTLTNATRDRIAREGIQVFSRFTLPRGAYDIQVVVHQPGGSIGRVSTPVEVPDYTDQALTMSDFAVSAGREDGLPLTMVEDNVLRKVLPASPTGRRRFRADDQVVVFNQVQDEHSLLSQKLDVRWTVASDDGQILKRDSQTLESKPQERGRFHSTVSMKALKPGAYVLTVEAYSTSGPPAVASRQLRFEIVP